MTDKELMQQALEMIGQLKPDNWHDRERQGEVWDALRERLALPQMQPCAGRNCGSTNSNLHSAECFEDYDKATGMAQPVAPKCGAIIEVFGKDWRLEYMSLPVGKHKLYTQQYNYTTTPQRKPLPPQSPCEMTPAERKMFKLGWLECEAAHGIGEKPDAP